MKKVIYIGLNGYAGSGKDTVAKMLSHILNYSFTDKQSAWESFKRNFDVTATATYPQNTLSNKCVCIAFADQLKELCANIFQIDVEAFYYKKETAWICINKDFEFTQVKPNKDHIVTAQEYTGNIDRFQNTNERFYMSIREVLVYVGTYMLQVNIGKNIFCNIVQKKIAQMPNLEYVICTDVRFLHEFDFVKKNNGIMINISRDGIKQLDNVAEHDLDEQDDFDFFLENNSDYYELFNQVWEMVYENAIFKNVCLNLYTHDGSDNYLMLREAHELFRQRDEDDNNEHVKSIYVWQLVTEYGTYRVGHDNGSIVYVDPSGGPMISVGDKLSYISDSANVMNKYLTVRKIYIDTITGYTMIETDDQ